MADFRLTPRVCMMLSTNFCHLVLGRLDLDLLAERDLDREDLLAERDLDREDLLAERDLERRLLLLFLVEAMQLL
jgi:hypothetical protein